LPSWSWCPRLEERSSDGRHGWPRGSSSRTVRGAVAGAVVIRLLPGATTHRERASWPASAGQGPASRRRGRAIEPGSVGGVRSVDALGIRGAGGWDTAETRAAVLRPAGSQRPPALAPDRVRSRATAPGGRSDVLALPGPLPASDGALLL